MLKLDIVQPERQGRAECAVCLLPCDLAPVMVIVRGEPRDDVSLDGYVCRSCLRGGSERIARQLRARAESHRRSAAQFERWAAEPSALPESVESLLRSETDDLDVILDRIARLWSEMEATRPRDPKHAELMAEIHSQAATYLQLLDRQRTDEAPKARQAQKTGRRDR